MEQLYHLLLGSTPEMGLLWPMLAILLSLVWVDLEGGSRLQKWMRYQSYCLQYHLLLSFDAKPSIPLFLLLLSRTFLLPNLHPMPTYKHQAFQETDGLLEENRRLEHNKKLKWVLDACWERTLKYIFVMSEITYLGHSLRKGDITFDANQMDTIIEMPSLKNV